MSVPRVLDIDELLKPIRDDAPAGVDIREDRTPSSPYYQIKDARNAARTAERAALRSDDPDAAGSADWSPVAQLAPQLLRETSKDLEIAAWYLEALVRIHGFDGLREGFALVKGMFVQFGDQLFPQPDEDGVSTRVAPLTGLNGDDAEGTLLAPIGMVPLFYDRDGAPLSAWQYRSARELAGVTDPDARQSRIDAGAITVEQFESAVSASDPAELAALRLSVEGCLAEFAALSDAMSSACGVDAPPTSNIRNALQDVLDAVSFLTPGVVGAAQAPTDAPEASEAAPTGSATPAAPAPAPGVIQDRSDAITALGKVADFYRKTEPHSPVSYSIDQALRWAQMPLHQLVSELIPDPSALAEFQLRTGMRKAGDSDQD